MSPAYCVTHVSMLPLIHPAVLANIRLTLTLNTWDLLSPAVLKATPETTRRRVRWNPETGEALKATTNESFRVPPWFGQSPN